MSKIKATLIAGIVSLPLLQCRTPDSGASLQDVGQSTQAADRALTDLTPSGHDYVQGLLDRFSANPASAMAAKVEKFDSQGRKVEDAPLFFRPEDITNKDFVTAKDRWRVTKIICAHEPDPEMCLKDPGARARMKFNNFPERLVDNKPDIVRTLQEMAEFKLLSARITSSPWSDDYWGHYLGLLGRRYGDPGFPSSNDWKKNYDYVMSTMPAKSVQNLNRLSPSEKYDAIMGDDNLSLTKALWREGQEYYEAYGEVARWMGICEGWALASYNLPRPVKPVTLQTPAGRRITFYPSDIKALGSLLHARGEVYTRHLGRRCFEKDPAVDENGRIEDDDCFDANPGAWHIAVVNQIGIANRSFVLDVIYDHEVWNQPVLAYQYRYFNPRTRRVVSTLAEATERLPFAGDAFKRHRDATARHVVGISMDLWYVVETSPTQETFDEPSRDQLKRVTYTYDVELDEDGYIIGGEWYTRMHPDFLWTANQGLKIETPGDALALETWDSTSPLPEGWRKGALLDTQKSRPLGKFVYELYRMAAAQDGTP